MSHRPHPDTALTDLHAGLAARPTPQSVLARLDERGLLDQLDPPVAHRARVIASHQSSPMATTYAEHPGLSRATAAAQRALAHLTGQLDGPAQTDLLALATAPLDPSDPAALATWTHAALAALGFVTTDAPLRRPTATIERTVDSYPRRPRGPRGARGAHPDLRTGLAAVDRRAQLPGVSVRAYRDASRALAHLATRTVVLARVRRSEQAVAFAKSRLARTIAHDDFVADPATAAFVAYYTARLGMRTLFTNAAQDRPMDEIAEALFDLAMTSPTSRPDVIARVTTRQRVLARLGAPERLDLLGRHFDVMRACAHLLRDEFDPKRDRGRMVVRQGDDSSTWNAATRAFNQARTGWLNLLASLALTDLLETFCPGKAPALVAADVAAWHAISGDDAHQDLAVFADLALPWDVVLGDASCTLAEVRAACATHGVDPDATGWTQPYRQDALAVAAPAPDLVHGVEVAWPELVSVLRRAGVFSGQSA